MQLFEIPKAVAGIKQNFPKNAQTGLGNHSLPSEGKPSHKAPCRKLMRAYILHRQTFQKVSPPKSGIPSQSWKHFWNFAHILSNCRGRWYRHTPNSNTFVIVTGSNGITLFGLHFSLCKFFRISIGHFYFFSSDCFDMPFIHFLVRASYSYSFVRCKRIQASCSS